MLSPAQLTEIVAMIQTVQDDSFKSEVRRASRIPHPCHVSIMLGNTQNPGPTFVVDMIDISHRGMSFVHTEEFEVGTEFVVRLAATNGDNVSILSKIVHWKPLSGHGNQFGARFTRVLDQKDDLQRAEPSAEDFMLTRTHLLD